MSCGMESYSTSRTQKARRVTQPGQKRVHERASSRFRTYVPSYVPSYSYSAKSLRTTERKSSEATRYRDPVTFLE